MTATAVNKVRSVSAARLPPIHSGERRLPGVCTPRHLSFLRTLSVARRAPSPVDLWIRPTRSPPGLLEVLAVSAAAAHEPVVPQNVVRREM
jgi:hypothetical protein